MTDNLQLNSEGKLKHFLSIEGLNKSLLTEILDIAESFIGMNDQQIKKVPLLRGKTIVNLFFENSTRTRTTFELAAKRLSADVLSMSISTSSTSKGESLLDTIRNLEAMFVDMFVVRHAISGAAHFIAQQTAPHISVINAGDGQHAHPTQAMLDMFTIRQIKKDFSNLRVAIIGDILHSRVARSQIQALNTLGAAEVRVIAPKTLLPVHVESLGVNVSHNLSAGLKDIDVIIMLRLQKERMSSALLPSESEYFKCFGLTEDKLKVAKPDAIVMHPGPINRGVEIDSKVADGPQSVILKQVSNGIAIRMAIMAMAMQKQGSHLMSQIHIKQGRIIDPVNNINRIGCVYIVDGKIISVTNEPAGFKPDTVINAHNQIVCPGFIDLSTRLRQPGQSRKATFKSETAAAASSGVTTMCLQPDTSPVIDTPAVAELVKELAEKANYPQIYPIAALTQKLEGTELSAMLSLKQAGCIAVGNANQSVRNLLILRRAMEYAASHDLLVMFRPNDYWLGNHGCAHEGAVATRYGLPGIPEEAETIALAQCLELVELTGCRVHFGQLSCKRSVIKIYQAKKYGLNVSADVAIHQLHLTENDIIPFDSNYHVLPPLRTEADRQYLRQGLASGTLNSICSDHQPHNIDAKLGAFPETEPGVSSLETLLPLMLKLVAQSAVTLEQGIASLSANPARVLHINSGALTVGFAADVCVFDPELEWQVDSKNWKSQGVNTPFWGQTMTGRVTHTLQAGKIIHCLETCG